MTKGKRKRIATKGATARLKLFQDELQALCNRRGFDLRTDFYAVGIIDRLSTPDPDWPVIGFFHHVTSDTRLRIPLEYKDIE